MTPLEIGMQSLGWLGMLCILYGIRIPEKVRRQAVMSTGATLLGVMAGYPDMQPVFFSLQVAVATVGFLNMRDNLSVLKLSIVSAGAAAGSGFALMQGAGLDTWFAILGLVGIALGYGGRPESAGGHQFLWLGLGAVGMVGYSLFGVLHGVWQAWPFLVLNIPFAYMAFAERVRQSKQ